MRDKTAIFWHRRDLRISDNLGLSKGISTTNLLIGIYVIDTIFYKKNLAPYPLSKYRLWFLKESLIELERCWRNAGSRLLILKGEPTKIIPQIADLLKTDLVIWNQNIEPYELKRDQQIKDNLLKLNIKPNEYLDHLLINPNLVETINGNPYTRFTPFYQNIINKIDNIESKIPIVNSSKFKAINFIKEEVKNKYKELFSEIKSQENLANLIDNNEFNKYNLCPCKPGEENAKLQLNEFCNSGKIYHYNNNRNIPSIEGTSFLSAALRFGTISIREVWNKSNELKLNKNNSKSNESIKIWQKELIWREFYQHAIINFPELINGAYREKWKNFPWLNNSNFLDAWKKGLTGIPIIDASMRQLNQTGWMHNRCRMIVASFLVKDLICDWRLGENYFMKYLVDGDQASNNGGWQWSTSSGMDSKPLRIFNPHTQSLKFDKYAKYIKYWVPELENINPNDILSGEISNIERRAYPKAIINHKSQQKLFKSIYATL
tara:strand:- start:54832 stop:56304 length:1473 start_codon:yes stop_codon:yes gene_type:complete